MNKQSSGRFWIIISCAVTFTLVLIAGGALFYKYRSSRKSAFEKGVIYARMHRHPEAIEEYKKALATNPNNHETHYNLGLSYLRLNQFEEALMEFKTSVGLNPDYSRAALQVAYIYFTFGNDARRQDPDSAVATEHYAKAEEVCNEVIMKDPKNVKAFDMLGHLNIARERFEEATSNFKRAVEIDVKLAASNIALVKHYMTMGDTEEAEAHCVQFLDNIDPECNEIRLTLASIRERQGRFDDAIAEAKKIIENDPKNLSAYIKLGMLNLRTKRFDEASAAAAKIIELSPKTPVAKYIKGCIHLKDGEFSNAIHNLEVAAVHMSKAWEPHYYLALALRGSNRLEEAKTELNTVLELVPGFVPARIVLAKLLAETGWFEEVIKHCKAALEYDPENIDALQLLGMTYTEQKKYLDAQRLFDTLVEVDHIKGLSNMAYLSLAKGELSKCMKECESVIDADPGDARPHYILGEALRRKGNVEEAIKEFEEAIRIKPHYPTAQLALVEIKAKLGKEDEAIDILLDVIKAMPDNLPPRLRLASLYRKKNENDKAVDMLKKALEIDPTNYSASLMLADIYFIEGMVDDSVALYRKASSLPEKKPTLLLNLAIAYQRKGDHREAIDACKQAVRLKGENTVLFYTVLANIYISQGDYSTASDDVYEARELRDDQKALIHGFIDICQANEDRGMDAAMSLNNAVLCGNSGMYELAIAQCNEASTTLRDPKVTAILWVMANLYRSADRLADAAGIYNEIIETVPNSASLYTELGNIYLLMQEMESAKDAYQKAADLSNEIVPTLIALASFYFQDGLNDDAVGLLEQALSHDEKSLAARRLLAEYYTSIGEHKTAEGYLREILDLDPSSYVAYSTLARIKFATGDFDNCIKLCNGCLLIHPNDVQLLNLLGVAHTRKGNIDAALAEFGKVLDIDENFIPAYLESGGLHLLKGRPAAAAELYKKAIKINPEAIAAHYGLGNSYVQMGRHNEAIEIFNTILKDQPEHVNSYVSLAETYLQGGDSAKAIENIEKTLDIAPTHTLAYTLLARIYKKEGDLDKTAETLKQILEHDPKSLTGYESGVIYIDQGKFEDAIAVYQKGVENFPTRASMHFQHAVALQLNGDYLQAVSACKRAVNLESDNTTLLLGMANVLMARNEFAAQATARIKVYKNIPQYTKESYFALIDFSQQNPELGAALSSYLNKGLIYSANGWYDRSINAYEEAKKIVPGNPFILLTLANSQLASGQEEDAVENYKLALENDPKCFTANIQLAQILQKKDDYDEAVNHYRQAIKTNPGSLDAHMNLGILLETKGMIEECVKEYEAAIALSPSTPTPYNNLAWIYATGDAQKLNKALKMAKKAKELSPEYAPVRDTLGWIFHLKGMDSEAIHELEEAVSLAPDNPTIRYHLATIYKERGFKRRALAHFERTIQIDEHFPEADLARKAIEAIKSEENL